MNPSATRNFYARFASDGRKQRLHMHLVGVQKLATRFAAEACDNPWLHAAANGGGLIHDLGKYGDPFQDMLDGHRTSSPETQHAVFGAAWATRHMTFLIGTAIQGHHSGMFDARDARVRLHDQALNPVSRC